MSSVEMMEASDPGEKGSVSDEMSSSSSSSKKSCADCHTTKTPLWRGGPAGPKSLCNACGIRYRKKRRAIMGMNKGGKAEEKKRQNRDEGKFGVSSMKMRLLALGKEVLLQRSAMEKQRKLGKEEEQAAMLLMALSCGSVYA